MNNQHPGNDPDPLWLRRWERIKTTYGHHALAAASARGRAQSITHLRASSAVGPR